MTHRYLECTGLFLGTLAAFFLALGQPHVVLAATGERDLCRVEKLAETAEGKAALAKAGISARDFKAALARLSPEQRQRLEKMARNITPRTRLAAKMSAEGYSPAEVNERLVLLADDEVAKLADNPDAATAGAGVGTIAFVLILVVVVVAITWHFVVMEGPTEEEAPPAPTT